MPDKSAEGLKPTMGSPTEQPQDPSRRRFLGRAGAAAAAGLGAVFLGKGDAEAGGGPEISGTERFFEIPQTLVEKRPELKGVMAKLLEVEGSPLKDDLAQGPKVYKIHAPNGLRLITRIRQDDDPNLKQNSFVRSKLYSEGGVQVSGDADTFIERGIFETGYYYLVVEREPKTDRPNYGVTVEALNRYDHGVDLTFLRDPQLQYGQKEIRYDPGTLPVLTDRYTGAILNIHPDAGFPPSMNMWDYIKVYAAPGKPEDLKSGKWVSPESDPKNIVDNCVIEHREIKGEKGNIKLTKKIIVCNNAGPDGKPGFPPESHVVVTLNAPDGSNFWVFRFFTL